jgi:hypothetical protein
MLPWVALTLALGTGFLWADDVVLPGHALSPQRARAESDIVFSGQLVSLDPVKSTHGAYVGKVVRLARPANGLHPAVATQDGAAATPLMSGDLGIPVSINVGAGETAPTVGESYVVYAKNSKPGYDAVKLTPTGSRGEPASGLGTPPR